MDEYQMYDTMSTLQTINPFIALMNDDYMWLVILLVGWAIVIGIVLVAIYYIGLGFMRIIPVRCQHCTNRTTAHSSENRKHCFEGEACCAECSKNHKNIQTYLCQSDSTVMLRMTKDGLTYYCCKSCNLVTLPLGDLAAHSAYSYAKGYEDGQKNKAKRTRH